MMTDIARPLVVPGDTSEPPPGSLHRCVSKPRARGAPAPGDPVDLARWLVEVCASSTREPNCAPPDTGDDDDGEDLDEDEFATEEATIEADLEAVAQALEVAKATVEQLQLKMALKASEQMDQQEQRDDHKPRGSHRHSSGELERFSRAGVPVVGARVVSSATTCGKCTRYFSAFQRGRNCATCGHLFCPKCISRQQIVPSKFGHGDTAVRVCDLCSEWLQRAMDRYFDAVSLVRRGSIDEDDKNTRDYELLELRVRGRPRGPGSTGSQRRMEYRSERHSIAVPDQKSKPWFSGNLRAMHLGDRMVRRRSTNDLDGDVDGDGEQDDSEAMNTPADRSHSSDGFDSMTERSPASGSVSSSTRQRALTSESSMQLPPTISIITKPTPRRRVESSEGEDANEDEEDSPAVPLQDVSELDNELKSPIPTNAPEDVINVTLTRARSYSRPTEDEESKRSTRKTKYTRSASIDFASLSSICGRTIPSPAVSDANESNFSGGGSASNGEPRGSVSSMKKYFDDSDIVDNRRSFVGSSDAGDSELTSDSHATEDTVGLPATVLRFAVYDVGSKESQSLKRSLRFGRKNIMVDRYTLEVDRAQGIVRVKSVFMHRYWTFRCDSVYSVMAVGNGGSGTVARVVVQTHVGHGYHSVEWEFGSEDDRDQFKAVVEELKSRKVAPISVHASRTGNSRSAGACDSKTISGDSSSAANEAIQQLPSSGLELDDKPVGSLFPLLPGEVNVAGADSPVTLLIGPAIDSTMVGEATVWGRMRGYVYVTNFRVIFIHLSEMCQSFHRSTAVAYIPLFAIISAQVVFAGGRRPRSTRAFQSTAPPIVVISCKDARTMLLEIEGPPQLADDRGQNLQATINKMADAAQRYRAIQPVETPVSPSTTLEDFEIGERALGTLLSDQYVRDSKPSTASQTSDIGANGSPRPMGAMGGPQSPAFLPSSGASVSSPVVQPLIPSSAERSDAFAFFYSIGNMRSIHDDLNGWKLFSEDREFKRQIVADPAVQPFLKFYQNPHGNMCKSYPAKLLVPASMNKATLLKVAEFRAKNRLPVVTYYHRRNRCVLVRSGQPLLGNLLSGSSSLSDQLLVGVYRRFPEIVRTQSLSAPSSRPIYVFDARKLKASTGNRLMGKGGVETPQDYPGAVVHHLDIANMYRMQSSYQALLKLVQHGGVDDQDKAWLTTLEATKWLSHVRQVLEGAVKIARVLELEGSSVLVHCSDGWDRTAQLTALAQIMIDPYFRTIRGFAVVVEKDWCSFGHKFAERLGGDRSKDPHRSKSSPVMLQFLDAVWQMLRQFPTAFEFDERFLLHIANALTSGLYGTFLYDTRFDRDANDVKNCTVSVWTPVLITPEAFQNPDYEPIDSPIWPWTSAQMMRLWESYFFQWHSKYYNCRWTASLVHHHDHNNVNGATEDAILPRASSMYSDFGGSPALGPRTSVSSARDRQSSGELTVSGTVRSSRHQKAPPMHKIFLFKS